MSPEQREEWFWRFAGQIIGVGVSVDFAVNHAKSLVAALEASKPEACEHCWVATSQLSLPEYICLNCRKWNGDSR